MFCCSIRSVVSVAANWILVLLDLCPMTIIVQFSCMSTFGQLCCVRQPYYEIFAWSPIYFSICLFNFVAKVISAYRLQYYCSQVFLPLFLIVEWSICNTSEEHHFCQATLSRIISRSVMETQSRCCKHVDHHHRGWSGTATNLAWFHIPQLTPFASVVAWIRYD